MTPPGLIGGGGKCLEERKPHKCLQEGNGCSTQNPNARKCCPGLKCVDMTPPGLVGGGGKVGGQVYPRSLCCSQN
ncbi:hypothetical protein HIM_10524 [Hirsutella minnesotensis 3608]|uniref:Uncharacterized protein n=1 Tax=Hirsutella minnesotensis 3608 TaxID=1043627 RepID=A0A0F8A273_9HYPO|nr:hypothetical protein HIM_10524 [Hirsutella minnesotensis 3608]